VDDKDISALKRRYLLWLYKTTKEAFDRYERKFIQLEIDRFILKEISRECRETYPPDEKKDMETRLEALRAYVEDKEKSCMKLKCRGKRTDPEYLFLGIKLQAVEKTVVRELGRQELRRIKALYEQEMAGRILHSRDEK